jgi:hypothetical protein
VEWPKSGPEIINQHKRIRDLWKDTDAGLPEVEDARKKVVGLKG